MTRRSRSKSMNCWFLRTKQKLHQNIQKANEREAQNRWKRMMQRDNAKNRRKISKLSFRKTMKLIELTTRYMKSKSCSRSLQPLSSRSNQRAFSWQIVKHFLSNDVKYAANQITTVVIVRENRKRIARSWSMMMFQVSTTFSSSASFSNENFAMNIEYDLFQAKKISKVRLFTDLTIKKYDLTIFCLHVYKLTNVSVNWLLLFWCEWCENNSRLLLSCMYLWRE